ncbi:hypothetical protein [Pontibacter virosus]|uniref:Uncharacterized protein n=1 Tax=Pontibacter virosus TaxID=1765052 RepID=A0A2U1AWZ9_9BACT|nr:hypothetical protein [Pontibacter virosus]PVY40940.1 hypothetical protein C8E01_106282 [Pontibacter virosus]
MKKSIRKYLGLVFGAISLTLLMITILNPPTDFDGGPMLAYNFFFFFPMLFGIGIFSTLAIIISARRLSRSKRVNKGLSISSFALSSPGIIYFALMLLRFVMITSEPEPVLRPEQIHNISTSLVLNGKTIHLTGFNFGTDYERRRVYISAIPYFNKEFKVQEAYFCQGDSEFELFYSNDTDSVYVYIPDSEPMYRNVNAERLDKVPVRAIQLNSQQIDSLKNLKSNEIKRFVW